MSLSQVKKLARLESIKSFNMPHNFGCIIMKQKKVVSKGHNFYSFDKTPSCSCHAEMDAISKHMKQLNLWKNFQKLLKFAYKDTGVFHRMEGKDR